jgi:hypothetical protein
VSKSLKAKYADVVQVRGGRGPCLPASLLPCLTNLELCHSSPPQVEVRRATEPGEGTAQGQGWEVVEDICPDLQRRGKCLLFAVAHFELGREATMQAVLERAKELCGRMRDVKAQQLLEASYVGLTW